MILTEQIRERIRAEFPKYPNKRAVTLPALHIVHDELRSVPIAAIEEIAQLLGIHPAEIHDTMSFYQFFRGEDSPLGRRRVWVCRSISCMPTSRTSGTSTPAKRPPTAASRWNTPNASGPARAPRAS